MQVVRICLQVHIRCSFTAGVDPASLNVMIEPAVECRLAVQYNGETVSAEKLAEIPEGETVTITAQAVESGTDTVIDSSFLKEGTANTLVYEVDGNEAARSDTGELPITLQLGEGRIADKFRCQDFCQRRQMSVLRQSQKLYIV